MHATKSSSYCELVPQSIWVPEGCYRAGPDFFFNYYTTLSHAMSLMATNRRYFRGICVLPSYPCSGMVMIHHPLISFLLLWALSAVDRGVLQLLTSRLCSQQWPFLKKTRKLQWLALWRLRSWPDRQLLLQYLICKGQQYTSGAIIEPLWFVKTLAFQNFPWWMERFMGTMMYVYLKIMFSLKTSCRANVSLDFRSLPRAKSG